MPRGGFTLIELSIVLVIIGLIIGGVVVGRDLISAATVRAQVSQLEKYISAVNTFRGKYGYLPGDIPNPAASSYSFAARGSYAGEGDGNGILEGVFSDAASSNYGVECAGELVMFWVDLSAAGLIDGGFRTASPTVSPVSALTLSSSPSIADYFPKAKIGNNNFIYVWSGGDFQPLTTMGGANNGINYFSIAAITQVDGAGGTCGYVSSNQNIPVSMAYAIDSKMDDGFPGSGRILARYLTANAATWTTGISNQGPLGLGNVSPSPSTCMDTGGAWSTNFVYSMSVNKGANPNCALSVQFQ